MEKYASIEQFKNVVKSVRDYSKKNQLPLPTLKFTGTVKLHGTNASGVVFLDTNEVQFQSRERVLSIESDNAGFCMFGERNVDVFRDVVNHIRGFNVADLSTTKKVIIFGEWCGQGVQKGVGISEIGKKIFVIFNITLVDAEGNRTELNEEQIAKVSPRGENDIFCIYQFNTYEIDIDFTNPNASQNTLVDLTLQVEEQCPVASAFGAKGIGEGIVWWNFQTGLKMKVKGEKHSASRVKTVKSIAASDIERMNSAQEFVDSVMTVNRMEQGLYKLQNEMGLDIDVTNTGTFIKWCVGDALKEERDVIVASAFDMKEITPGLAQRAKDFWFKTINDSVGAN